MASLEIAAKYCGEVQKWPNDDGTHTIIGIAIPAKISHDILAEHDVDPTNELKLKGTCELADLESGKSYRFFGTWTSYQNRRTGRKERQFAFRTFVPHVPRDPEGVADYLSHAGKGNGIGPSKARRLVDELGTEAVLSICRGNLAEVMRITGVSQGEAERFAETLRSQAATEDAILQVDELLIGWKFPKMTGRRAIKKWGNKAAEVIRDNPYSLMEFAGIGFGLTDNLWVQIGKPPGDIKRQAVCVWNHLATDRNGHTWFPVQTVISSLNKIVGVQADPRAAIMAGKELADSGSKYGGLATCRSEGGIFNPSGQELWIAEALNADNEAEVAQLVAEAECETSTTTAYSFESVESEHRSYLDHVRCKRCHRQLTAPMVHVLNGVPYGPTCIGYVDPTGAAESLPLAEWIDKNPRIRKTHELLPSGLIQFPQVSLWPEPSALQDVTDHQRAEIGKALTARVGMLGGSPGTGKTWTVAATIKAALASGVVGVADIAVGAPTGKAAVRLSETLRKHGLPITARTWHSLLGIAVRDADDDSEAYQSSCQGDGKAPFRMLVGDESSMLDIGMMANIFRARDRGCHVLLVGDVNQLPPVGNGSPFRDMIQAQVAYGELVEIKRNSGGIVEACAAIRDGEEWASQYFRAGQNLEITGHDEPSDQLRAIDQLIDQAGNSGFDPVWDVQVVTAVNEKSPLSRVAINAMLQEKLNANPVVENCPFRLADKVVCTRNSWHLATDIDDPRDRNEHGEVYVANGEIGKIIEFTPKHVCIELSAPFRVIQVPRYGDGGLKQWDLAYALSVHKFQGSEQRFVIVALDSSASARMICDRSWIYTAISRAQERCYLVGSVQSARRMCRVQKIDQRKTFLADRIQFERSKQQFWGL